MRWFSLVLVAAMAFTASDAILLEAMQFKVGLFRQFLEKLQELKGRKLEKFKPAATTTTTYRPPTTTTDSCTQLVWETDANGNTVSVLKNVCGLSTTTTTLRPTTTTSPTTTTDSCTQLVWETDAHGNTVSVLKNVCGATTTTKTPYRPPAPPATTTRPTTTTTTDPCTQEVTETDAHGNIVTVLQNVCGATTTTKTPYRPPAPPTTTTTRPTTTTTADPCTQLVWETDAYGNTISVLKNVCGTTTTTKTPYRPPAPPATTTTRPTTTTTADPCTEEVYEVFPNGEFVVLRKNICGETSTITTTRRPTTQRPLPATTPTKLTSDPCTQEVWETLPNGELTVVRKNICVELPSPAEQTPRAPRTVTDDPTPPPPVAAAVPTVISVDECTQEAWEVLPNGEAGIVRRNICVEVVEEDRDECIQEVEVIFNFIIFCKFEKSNYNVNYVFFL